MLNFQSLEGNCPCLNEGKCIYLTEGGSDFYCDCPDYASGRLCDQLLACSSINECPESDACRLIAPGYHCEVGFLFPAHFPAILFVEHQFETPF